MTSAPAFIIAAADTVMDRPSSELAAEVFPGVEVRPGLGEFETLLSIDRARAELGVRAGALLARPLVTATGR